MISNHRNGTAPETNACWIYNDPGAVREAIRLTKSLSIFKRTATVPMMTMDALEEFKMKINRRAYQITLTPISKSSDMFKVTIRKRNLFERIFYKPEAREPQPTLCYFYTGSE